MWLWARNCKKRDSRNTVEATSETAADHCEGRLCVRRERNTGPLTRRDLPRVRDLPKASDRERSSRS